MGKDIWKHSDASVARHTLLLMVLFDGMSNGCEGIEGICFFLELANDIQIGLCCLPLWFETFMV